MSLIRARWDDFLLIAVLGGVLIGLIATLLLRPIIAGVDIVNDELVGWRDGYTAQLVVLVAAGAIVYLVASLAQYRLAWGASVDREEGWAAALQYALGASPRFLGWAILGALPFVAFVAVFVLLLYAGVGFLGLAALAAVIWWSLVVSFIPVALVSQPRGTNLITAALAVVKGRWWRVFGRFLLIQFLAGLVLQVVGVVMVQLLGLNALGLDIVDAGNNRVDIVKDLGTPLHFFISTAVMTILSLAATVAQVAGATSIAADVAGLASPQSDAAY
jgi:hypothetical protein